MPTFTYPGVYIEELSSGVHSITGVATSVAAFIGWAPQGPTTEARLVESWSEYQALYGGLDARSFMGYSVNQFFTNGGQQAYIVRLVWDGTLPSAPGTHLISSATAVATGAGYATTQITATLGAIVSPPVTLSVGAPVLQGVLIEPASLPPIPIGAKVQFNAIGVNSDGTKPALAAPAWISSDPTILSFGVGGLATANLKGTVVVTARSGLVSGSINVTVASAPLTGTGFTITALTPTLVVGQTQQLKATFAYADGTTQDVTNMVAWQSDTPANASVDGAPGLVKGVAAGPAKITATLAALTTTPVTPPPAFGVTVAPAVPIAVRIYPGTAVLKKTQIATFVAMEIMSDGSQQEVVGGIWSCNNTAVATITANGVDANKEDATAVADGSATISVVSGAFSASATLNVSAATLTSILIRPLNAEVAVNTSTTPVPGLQLQLKALGIYDDGTNADLTEAVDWTSTTPVDARVDPNTGVVTGLVVNPSVTMTAKWQGISVTPSVKVTAPVLQSIAITPASLNLASGATSALKATGTLSDGTTSDLTSTVAWNSSAPTVANVSPVGVAASVALGGSLTLFAANPGAWGNNLRVSITPQTADPTRFGLLVQQITPSGQLQTLESFANLSTVSTDSSYVVTVIDSDSQYLSFIPPGSTTPVAPSAPPSLTPPLSPVALSGGADGDALWPATDKNFEIAMMSVSTAGVFYLDRVDIFNLLCVPGETDAPIISLLQGYCADKRAFYIVDPPKLSTPSKLIQSGPVGSTTGSITAGPKAANSAYYFPWIEAPDPLVGNRPTLYPPCGFVAGIYAATDSNRGVWKAPAGIQAGLTGVSGLQYNLTDLENGDLNIQAINCLREFKIYGDVVWGARTLQGNDQAGSEWKYIPIRRLALYIESSLYDGTQWVVFEPNDVPLWGQIRLNVGAFMQGLFLQGAFQGTSPQQAYFVKCDAENNPQASIDLGIVNILVGFAPLYPAEFVVIQIQQIAGQVA
jgi:phage tail sheath protein FI